MLQHLLQYLNGTKHYVLEIQKDSLDLQVIGFGDANFANDIPSRRSRSGVVMQVGSTTVLCASSLQTIMADLTTAAETLALTCTAKEFINIRLLLEWLGAPQRPSTIYCDNKSTVHNTKYQSKEDTW
jgi:hypothetical protein